MCEDVDVLDDLACYVCGCLTKMTRQNFVSVPDDWSDTEYNGAAYAKISEFE